METIKCVQCGAAVTSESRFCNFCGAKIPDDVQKSEHTYIDKAELTKIEYEKQIHDEQVAREDAARIAYKKKRLHLMLLALILPPIIAGLAFAMCYVLPGFGTVFLFMTIVFGAIILWFVFGIITVIRYMKA